MDSFWSTNQSSDLRVELVGGTEPTGSSGGHERSRPLLAAGAAIAAVAVVVTTALTGGSGTRRDPSETPADHINQPSPDGPHSPESGLAVGSAPTVEVEPAIGLIDGDPLIVSGSGFAPHAAVTITQCVLGLVEQSPNCYQGRHRTAAPATSSGDFRTTIDAYRFITTDAGTLDCADLTAGRCVLVAVGDQAPDVTSSRIAPAMQLRYVESSARAPAEDESAHPGTPPRIHTADRSAGTASLELTGTTRPGETVLVTGSGFETGVVLDTFVCATPIDVDPQFGVDSQFGVDPVNWCGWPPDGLWGQTPTVREDGTLAGVVVVPDSIELWGWGTSHSCVYEPCWLVLSTGHTPGLIPVASAPLSPGRDD